MEAWFQNAPSLKPMLLGNIIVVLRWSHQLESIGFPGRYMNVFGGPPACCPGGASSKFHLIDRPGGPGDRFEFAQGQIELADVSRWRACAGLCAVPTQPRITLRPCPAEPQWREVRAQG